MGKLKYSMESGSHHRVDGQPVLLQHAEEDDDRQQRRRPLRLLADGHLPTVRKLQPAAGRQQEAASVQSLVNVASMELYLPLQYIQSPLTVFGGNLSDFCRG